MKRKILFITNYYPPETGAAANRIALLAEQFVNAGFETRVLCPLPNYPTGKVFEQYKRKSGHTELLNGVKVTRLWVYATNSANKWKRLLAMVSFSISLAKYRLTHKLPALIFIQCSPLLVGFFGTLFFRSKRRKILLNVSDLWPLAGKELGKLEDGFSYRMLERLERFNYKNAALIMGQSKEILSYVGTLFPQKKKFLYRNFPDFTPPKISNEKSSTTKMVYAGLLGVAQGILVLCEVIDLPKDWEFHIYGDGVEKAAIERYLANSDKSIVYKGSLSRKQLHQSLLDYDLTIIPLVKRIYGSVPSKVFEYGRLGLPMIYFGGGEGELLVSENKLGWVVPSGDFQLLNKKLEEIANSEIWPSKEDVQLSAITAFDAQAQFESLLKELN